MSVSTTSQGAPSGQGYYPSPPSYEYSEHIQTPELMGASSGKSWDNFKNNLRIGTDYMTSLTSNNFNVNKTGHALGMDYLLDTNTLCSAIDLPVTVDENGNSTHPKVKRYTYIATNNKNQGIIGSMIKDMEKGFSVDNLRLSFTPSIDCQQTSLFTLDKDHNTGIANAWVAIEEIKGIDPCKFSDYQNSITGVKCAESFENYSDSKYDKYAMYPTKKKEKDVIESVYLTGLMVFGLYLVYCFIKKNK